jgi:hypothetical protein
MTTLTSRQSASLASALRMVPPVYHDGLLRTITALLPADTCTGIQLVSAMEQAFAGEGLDEYAPLQLEERY